MTTLKTLLAACGLLVTTVFAQALDTWSNVPSAPDDRYTNPRSKLYAGPNGWVNFGEVRATVANASKTTYGFKTGLAYLSTPSAFVFAANPQTRVLMLDFGSERPEPGVYQAGPAADAVQKKVRVSFSDSSGGQLLEWASQDKAGTITVSLENRYRYFKARDLRLTARGPHNIGDLKQPMSLGLEGAVEPD